MGPSQLRIGAGKLVVRVPTSESSLTTALGDAGADDSTDRGSTPRTSTEEARPSGGGLLSCRFVHKPATGRLYGHGLASIRSSPGSRTGHTGQARNRRPHLARREPDGTIILEPAEVMTAAEARLLAKEDVMAVIEANLTNPDRLVTRDRSRAARE